MFEKKKYKSQREKGVDRINKYLFKHDSDDGMFMKGAKTLGDWTAGQGLRAGAAGLDFIEGDLLGGKQILPKALQGEGWTDEGTQRDWTGQDAMDVALALPGVGGAGKLLGKAPVVGGALKRMPGTGSAKNPTALGKYFRKTEKAKPIGKWRKNTLLDPKKHPKKHLALKTAAATGTLGGLSNMVDGGGGQGQGGLPENATSWPDVPLTPADQRQKMPGAPMTGLGATGSQRQRGMQTFANAIPQQIARRGGSGSTMTNLAQGRAQAEADRLMDNEIKKAKGTYDPTYSEDPEGFMKNRYDSTGGRAAGAWDSMTPEQKREKTSNYQANSYYNSASPEGRAADKRLEDSGWTAPRADGIVNAARAEMGMPSIEQSRLDELDRRAGLSGPVGAAGPEGPAGSQAPAQMGGGNTFVDPNDPTNENKRPGQVSRDEFMEQSGMRTPGTGLTQNPDGSYNALEFGDTYEKSGGDKTAEEYLVGPQDPPPAAPQAEPDGQPTFTSGATPQQMEFNRPSLPPSDPLADQPAPAPQGEGKMEPFVDEQGRKGLRPTEESLASPLPSKEEYLESTPSGNYEEYAKSRQSMAEDRDVSGGEQEIQMPEGEIPFSPDTNFEAQSMYEKSQMPETEVMGGAVSSDPSAPEELTAPGQTGPRIEGGYAKMQNLRNQGSDRSFTTADGSSNPLDDLSEGTRRLSSDMQDYGDAAFQNKADALGYLNRQAPEPTMDEPAPAAPEAPAPEAPAPEAPNNSRNNPFDETTAALATGAAGLAYLLSRGKIKPKQAAKMAEKLGPKAQKLLGNTRLNNVGQQRALPLLKPKPGQKMLGHTAGKPAQLGNKAAPKQLNYKAPKYGGIRQPRHQPLQGAGVPKLTESTARNLVTKGRNIDGSVATKAQRIAAMRYLKANRL